MWVEVLGWEIPAIIFFPVVISTVLSVSFGVALWLDERVEN